MAKINRYGGNLQAFGSEAQGTERTVFGDTTQDDTLDANITTEFLRGWGIVGVNENPTKQDFNALGYTVSQLVAYLHQAGVPEWHVEQEYFEGAVTITQAGVYRSLVDGNIGNDPDTDDGSNWLQLIIDPNVISDIDVAGGSSVTLTDREAQSLAVRLTGELTADIDVIVPDTARHYVFINATGGGFVVTVKTSAGTGITVPQSRNEWLYSDGTNVLRAIENGPYFRGHINGLEVANNSTDPDHDIDVSTGVATVDGGAGDYRLVELPAAFTKLLDATFAEGDGNGGMASGESLPANGTVHIWLIAKEDGTTDVFANDNATSGLTPTLPSGFTRSRRIASRTTDGSNNLRVVNQSGDWVEYEAPVTDLAIGSSNNSSQAVSFSCPEGIDALVADIGPEARSSSTAARSSEGRIQNISGNRVLAASATSDQNNNGVRNLSRGLVLTEGNPTFNCTYRTDNSSQIDFRSYGWFDDRGRNL